jgi:hypothetical protein
MVEAGRTGARAIAPGDCKGYSSVRLLKRIHDAGAMPLIPFKYNGLVGREALDIEALQGRMQQRLEKAAILFVAARDFDAGDDVRLRADHDMRFEPR